MYHVNEKNEKNDERMERLEKLAPTCVYRPDGVRPDEVRAYCTLVQRVEYQIDRKG
jgi:hypothetical protein